MKKLSLIGLSISLLAVLAAMTLSQSVTAQGRRDRPDRGDHLLKGTIISVSPTTVTLRKEGAGAVMLTYALTAATRMPREALRPGLKVIIRYKELRSLLDVTNVSITITDIYIGSGGGSQWCNNEECIDVDDPTLPIDGIPHTPLIPRDHGSHPRPGPRDPVLPNLVVTLAGPSAVCTGEDIGRRLHVEIKNDGDAIANKGFTIVIALSGEPDFPRRTAILKSITSQYSLRPGQSITYPIYGATIPRDERPGVAFISAKADWVQRVFEYDKQDNVAIVRVQVNRCDAVRPIRPPQ